MCDSLGLEPKPNNGTLRLPLSQIGFHDATSGAPDPEDLPASATSDELMDPEADSVISISLIEASSAADPNVLPPHLVGIEPPAEYGDDEPGVDYSPPFQAPPEEPNGGNKSSGDERPGKGKTQSWWDILSGEIQELKEWANNIIHGDKVEEEQ